MLERRPQETAYKGKKSTHYTLHLNEAPGTAEAARALLPEVDPDEAAPEILDGEQESALPIMVNCPPIIPDPLDEVPPTAPPEIKTDMGTITVTPGGIPPLQHELKNGNDIKAVPVVVTKEDVKEDVKEYKENTEAHNKDKEGAKESKEFLEGLKKDSKEELGVEGGKPVKSREIDKEKAKIFPAEFPKFMAFCKATLEKAGMGDIYKDTLHLYSVTDMVKLAHDVKKQGDIRTYLEALLEEKGLV
jgi:hypothetical protein